MSKFQKFFFLRNPCFITLMLEQHNSSMSVAWYFDANNSVAISGYECIKKIQACAGFEPMTSVIPMQCSTITELTNQLGAGHYVGS